MIWSSWSWSWWSATLGAEGTLWKTRRGGCSPNGSWTCSPETFCCHNHHHYQHYYHNQDHVHQTVLELVTIIIITIITIRQLFSKTIRLGFKKPWKWKWSNVAKRGKMCMIWCISITNSVKSYKKLNEIAQTVKFTVFTMCGRELPDEKGYFWWKLVKRNRIFELVFTLVWLL